MYSLELYLGYVIYTQSKTKGVGLPYVGGQVVMIAGGRERQMSDTSLKSLSCEVTDGGGGPERAKLTVIFGQNISVF